jgi:hypothetical protein
LGTEKQSIFELHRAGSGAATRENRHGTFDESFLIDRHIDRNLTRHGHRRSDANVPELAIRNPTACRSKALEHFGENCRRNELSRRAAL